ncbi:hypothetical protein [Proteus mirabilis]|uniref:hypothetical protein n=1 Tax=Proteus mirabilis TaxID=584 RepID=UPI003D016416
MNTNISNLYAWEQIKSGTDSSITISDDGRKSRMSGSPGSGAQLWMRLPINNAGIFKISFYAKKNRGDGHVWLVNSKSDKVMNSVKVSSENWERYEISGGNQFLSKNGDNYTRISAGIATADDGDIEICDICVEEINPTFGQLRTIAAGIVLVGDGKAETTINHGGVVSTELSSDGYSIIIRCSKLHQSIKTPFILITEMSSGKSEKPGMLRSRYYDKSEGCAYIQLVNLTNKSPMLLTDTNLLFAFEVRSI